MPINPVIPNDAARRIFLHRHLLGDQPSGPGRGEDLMQVIRALGFVQVDSVTTVERAHHMILMARRPAYRPSHLRPLLERHRSLFEHWTHDAAIIPADYLRHWKFRFRRDREELHAKWLNWQGEAYRDELNRVFDHVRDKGPVRSGDLIGDAPRGKSGGWWDWHPSKAALEYLWRSGDLAICARDGFTKVYDLADRVYGEHARAAEPEDCIDWFNNAAMDRLGFATSGQISAFWDHVSPKEAALWCAQEVEAGRLEKVEVAGATGQTRTMLARPGLADEVDGLAPAPGRIRVLSPFDPAIRDRKRTEFLFGYHYRIEIFVPEEKRQYGYYVFPLLEGERLIGRIDMKTNRDADSLVVRRLWLEPGVRASKGRLARLEAELQRVARFTGVGTVTFDSDWLAD